MSDDYPTCIIKMLDEFRTGGDILSSSEVHQPRHSMKRPALENVEHSHGDTGKMIKKDSFLSQMETKTLERKLEMNEQYTATLEKELHHIKIKITEKEHNFSVELKNLKDVLRSKEKRVSHLESKLNEYSEKEELNAAKYTSAMLDRNVMQKKILQLENEKSELQQHIDQISSPNKIIEDLEAANESLNSKLEALREELNQNQQLVKKLNRDILDRNRELADFENGEAKLLVATQRIRELETDKESYHEGRKYVESQKKKLSQFADYEKELLKLREENKQLRADMTKNLHDEYLLEDLQRRQSRMDSMEKEIVKLRTDNGRQLYQLEQWEQLSRQFCQIRDNDAPIPHYILMKKKLQDLTKSNSGLLAEKCDLENMLNSFKIKYSAVEQKLESAKEEVHNLKLTSETHLNNLKRMRKQLALISWERNDLRNLLDSYQKDMTITSNDGASPIDYVQKAIEGYKRRLKELEKDPSINFNTGVDPKVIAERDELLRKFDEIKKENEKLKEEIEGLRDQLLYRALIGDYDPRKTKIMHLKNNPADEAFRIYEDKLTTAKNEVMKLQARVKLMEEGISQDVTKLVEERVDSNCSKEIEDLREQIKSYELQKQRLMEVFKKQIQDIRDAFYQLMGYKLDCLNLSTNKYRLCSMYADNPEDNLLFQINDEGLFELAETEYSSSIPELIDLHLKKHKSIPLFLSSLTIDLFSKQTLMTM